MYEVTQKDFDIEMLPCEAKSELMHFYQFLLFKYRKKVDKIDGLKKLFLKPRGQLPCNYKFDREEVHER
jgi:hypothetical protein